MVVERRAQRTNRTRSGRTAVKERDLLKRYGSQEKVDKLKALLKQKGLWEWDEDFPQDEEETPSTINIKSILLNSLPKCSITGLKSP